MRQCVKITVSGKVHGVGYRKFVQKSAEKYSVEGTVENAGDNFVIIHACGSSENLDKLVDGLYKGPKGSEVKDISIEPLMRDKDFRRVFRIIGIE